MFGFHWPELLVVLIVALIIFGPKRLPEVGGALGRGIRDFRRGVAEAKEESGIAEIEEQVREVRDTVRAVPTELEASVRAAGDASPRAGGTAASA